MTTYRWYVLGRVAPLPCCAREGAVEPPIEPNALYEFVGWSRTKEARRERCLKLDRQGRQGIWVYASSRPQAVRRAVECWGVRVYGYDARGKVTTYGEKATAADPDAKAISMLSVNCSLRLRNFGQLGAAASDNCNRLADSAVELANGNLMWRCPRHRGIRSIHPAVDLGPVHTHIIVRSS